MSDSRNATPVRFSPAEQVNQNFKKQGIITPPKSVKLGPAITRKNTTGNANSANEKILVRKEIENHLKEEWS